MRNDRLEALRMLAASGKQGPKSAAIVELCDALQACQRRRERAIGPTLVEVMTYAEQIGMNSGSPEDFFDYYEEIGWVQGKNKLPIKKWQAACRRWHRRAKTPVVGNEQSDPSGWVDFLNGKLHPIIKFRYAPEWLRLDFSRWKKEAGKKNNPAST